MPVPNWPFNDQDINGAVLRLREDRNPLILVQVAERYEITVAEVQKRLAKDAAFREDVLLWLGLNKLRQAAERAAAPGPKIVPASGPASLLRGR